MKVIRLRMPIRSGCEIHPENSVFDADDAVADKLIGHDPPVAEETDALERHPRNPLLWVDEFPVTGTEKFPIPEGHELIVPPAMFELEGERRARARAKGDGPVLLAPDEHEPPAAPKPAAKPANPAHVPPHDAPKKP